MIYAWTWPTMPAVTRLHEKMLKSLIGMQSYQQVRRILSTAMEELSVLDTFPD
jgi:hypothetical protein